MKNVTMFMFDSCPYCKEASRFMEELKVENPKYSEVALSVIDERIHPEIADKYDYYYVPTYYVDGVKVHEGASSKEDIKAVLEKASE